MDYLFLALILGALISIGSLIRTIYVMYFTPILTAAVEGGSTEFISILLPVRNEMNRVLDKCVASLTTQCGIRYELIAIDDQSEDGSFEFLIKSQKDNPSLMTVIRGQPVEHGWLGKLFALHQAKARATGDWIALIDADVELHPTAISAAVEFAKRHELAAVSALPYVLMVTPWEQITIPVISWLSLMRVSPTQTNRSSSRHAFGYGNFILVKRAAHDAIGGFESYKADILDDAAVMERLKRKGYGINVVDGRLLIRSRMYTCLAEIVEGFSKNSFAALNNSLARLSVFLLLECLCVFLPVIVLLTEVGSQHAASSSTVLAALSLLCILATHAFMSTRMPASIWNTALFPVGHAIASYITIVSALKAKFHQGTLWKGRNVGGNR